MCIDNDTLKIIHETIDKAFESFYKDRSDRLIQLRDMTVECLRNDSDVSHVEVDPEDPSQINATVVLKPTIKDIKIDFGIFMDTEP